MKIEAIKRSIVSDKALWGESATIPELAKRFSCPTTKCERMLENLSAGGFVVPSPKGPVFGTFSVSIIEANRLTLSSLESVAAARAIHFTSNAAKFNFDAMSVALADAITRDDPYDAARLANGLLACLFDIAELDEMGKAHQRRSTEAMVYAWATHLNEQNLPALQAVFDGLLSALQAKDVSAAMHAAHVREIGLVTNRNTSSSQAA